MCSPELSWARPQPPRLLCRKRTIHLGLPGEGFTIVILTSLTAVAGAVVAAAVHPRARVTTPAGAAQQLVASSVYPRTSAVRA